MKYEFHADDYVETKDGQIGYITTFTHSHDGENTILVKYKDGRTQGYKFHDEEPHHFFNRIGQYDFTKKEEGKIELLACETTSDYSNEKLRKKINELVEAVNRLEEKVNETR